MTLDSIQPLQKALSAMIDHSCFQADNFVDGHWAVAVEKQVIEIFRQVQDSTILAKLCIYIQKEADLSPPQIASLIGAGCKYHSIDVIDDLVWDQLAILEYIFCCDFFEIVKTKELASFCGHFLYRRLQEAEDPTYDAGRWAYLFCIRLSGYPLIYSYLEKKELLWIAEQLLAYAYRGMKRCIPEEKLLSEFTRLTRGMISTLQEYAYWKESTLSIPESNMDITLHQGDDFLLIYTDKK